MNKFAHPLSYLVGVICLGSRKYNALRFKYFIGFSGLFEVYWEFFLTPRMITWGDWWFWILWMERISSVDKMGLRFCDFELIFTGCIICSFNLVQRVSCNFEIIQFLRTLNKKIHLKNRWYFPLRCNLSRSVKIWLLDGNIFHPNIFKIWF